MNPIARTEERKNSIFREFSGPLTRELVQRPGEFGLGQVPERLKPDATTTMVCGFCSTGCGLNVHLRDGQAINLTPTTTYPVNLGMACPKGWEALTPLSAPNRATKPLLRDADGVLKQVTWDKAMRKFVARMKDVQRKYGPDSVAWLGTGQIATEELAFLGALAKFGMGVRHGDGNTRQCMATAAVAYKQSFGFDAPPYTYQDFEESDVIVLVGSNLCIAHPIMWQRVLRNRKKPEIIVVDPRKTETAMAATQHYALKPKSDLVLFYGIANLLIQNDWLNLPFIEAHTTDFNDFVAHVRQFTPDKVASETGLTVGQIYRFAESIYRGKAVSFWWTMGVNQGHESTRTAQAIINLALMTGNIGRPGTGANSITGQCNAMGSRLFSNTTNLLGGHEFTNAAHRAKIATTLGIPVENIPEENSWAYDEIMDGIERGVIKALWVVATNTAHSWINQKQVPKMFEKLDLLVVQDMYTDTDSCKHADIVLPAAGWGEKEGTFINSERRFGLLKKVALAPGEALSDFNIFRLVAGYWGCAELFKEWSSPEAVFQILKRCSAGQPCDISAINDYEMLDAHGGIQWPCTADSFSADLPKDMPPATNGNGNGAHKPPALPTQRRLFSDGRFYHADGRAKFFFANPQTTPETTDDDYPFVLLTGRGTSAQWHTQTRTGTSAVLRKLHPEKIYAEINPDDARRLGIDDNELVQIESRRGQIVVKACLTPTINPGQIFIPMHYETANQLTFPAFDPYSRQPSYKHCAVKIERLPDRYRR